MRRIFEKNLALWNGSAKRFLLLKWSLCAALLSGMALSPRLWTANRDFPQIPIFDGLPALGQFPTVLLTACLVGAVVAVAVSPNPRSAFVTLLMSAALLVEFDINRLQPWFYQYALMFFPLSLMRWELPESRESKAAWSLCAFIVAALYIWSGIQKANPGFVDQVFPFLAQPLGKDAVAMLRPLAFAAPALEILTGLLLFVPKTRAVGLGMVVGMHLLLLLALGPLGINMNSVVWPWNLWMPVIAFALFHRKRESILPHAWLTPIGKAIMLLTGLLPALNLVGKWDDYLSASLYSGRAKSAWIYFTEDGAKRFLASHPKASSRMIRQPGAMPMLHVYFWCMDDLNVPLYPEERVYRSLAARLLKEGISPGEMELVVKP